MATDTTAPPTRRTTDDDLAAGLDALETPVAAPRGSAWRSAWRAIWPVLAALGALLVVWQVAYLLELKPPYALPSPADTWQTLLGTIQDLSLIHI